MASSYLDKRTLLKLHDRYARTPTSLIYGASPESLDSTGVTALLQKVQIRVASINLVPNLGVQSLQDGTKFDVVQTFKIAHGFDKVVFEMVSHIQAGTTSDPLNINGKIQTNESGTISWDLYDMYCPGILSSHK